MLGWKINYFIYLQVELKLAHCLFARDIIGGLAVFKLVPSYNHFEAVSTTSVYVFHQKLRKNTDFTALIWFTFHMRLICFDF
jgi:hypothetical protein